MDKIIEKCIKHKKELLDLERTNERIFDDLLSHNNFIRDFKYTIKIICADHCKLKSIPDLSIFVNLESLDISHNEICTLPKLPLKIEELVVNNNKIEEIPHLPNILRINAFNNNLKRISSSKTLNHLSAQNNPELLHLPNECVMMKYLEIGNTSIKKIPKTFNNLKYLDIDNTKITKLPALKSLIILRCIDSELDDISEIKTLHTLLFANSKIRILHYMPKLHIITFHFDDYEKIKMSNKYKINGIYKNKKNIIKLEFNVDDQEPEEVL